MNNKNSLNDTEAPTTREELISRLSKRLQEAKGSLGWWTSKQETGRTAFGDVDAEVKRYAAEVESAEFALKAVLESPPPHPRGRDVTPLSTISKK